MGSPGPGEVTREQFTTFPSSGVHFYSSLGAETEVGENTHTPSPLLLQNKLQKQPAQVRAVRGGPPRALMKEPAVGLCHKGSQRDKATEQRRPWGPSRVLSPKLQALEAPSQTPATPAARGGREVILSVHSLGLEGARPPGLLSGGNLKPARRACRCNLASFLFGPSKEATDAEVPRSGMLSA